MCLAFLLVSLTDTCCAPVLLFEVSFSFAVPELSDIKNVDGWILRTFKNHVNASCAQFFESKCSDTEQLTNACRCFTYCLTDLAIAD